MPEALADNGDIPLCPRYASTKIRAFTIVADDVARSVNVPVPVTDTHETTRWALPFVLTIFVSGVPIVAVPADFDHVTVADVGRSEQTSTTKSPELTEIEPAVTVVPLLAEPVEPVTFEIAIYAFSLLISTSRGNWLSVMSLAALIVQLSVIVYVTARVPAELTLSVENVSRQRRNVFPPFVTLSPTST